MQLRPSLAIETIRNGEIAPQIQRRLNALASHDSFYTTSFLWRKRWPRQNSPGLGRKEHSVARGEFGRNQVLVAGGLTRCPWTSVYLRLLCASGLPRAPLAQLRCACCSHSR